MRVKRDDERKVFWIVTSNSFAWMTEDYEIHTVRDFPYSNNYDLSREQQGRHLGPRSNGIYVTPADELLENGEDQAGLLRLSNGLPCIATANSYSD